ncbi:MAG: SGNH/GDSL hydrolase family protein [Pseudomonadota bacterium]
MVQQAIVTLPAAPARYADDDAFRHGIAYYTGPVNTTRTLGRTLLLLIAYGTAAAVVYVASLLLLQHGIRPDIPWVAGAQQALFRAGMAGPAANWLALPGCIAPDPVLVYKPAEGRCEFNHIEFSTTLHFTAAGRDTGPRPAGPGIAVIGDSHAMGWGVNDTETFAAQLQQLSGRPVYNLGVASYGTVRELLRLERSGLLDQIDTVIIQYCNNDYNENRLFDGASRTALQEKIFGHGAADPDAAAGNAGNVLHGYWLTLKAPFKHLADRLRRKNFARHYEVLIDTLRKHAAALQGKRVIVFYSNPFGQRYRNYPLGRDAQLPNVYFADLGLTRADYFRFDSHLTPAGHRKVAAALLRELAATATAQRPH